MSAPSPFGPNAPRRQPFDSPASSTSLLPSGNSFPHSTSAPRSGPNAVRINSRRTPTYSRITSRRLARHIRSRAALKASLRLLVPCQIRCVPYPQSPTARPEKPRLVFSPPGPHDVGGLQLVARCTRTRRLPSQPRPQARQKARPRWHDLYCPWFLQPWLFATSRTCHGWPLVRERMLILYSFIDIHFSAGYPLASFLTKQTQSNNGGKVFCIQPVRLHSNIQHRFQPRWYQRLRSGPRNERKLGCH